MNLEYVSCSICKADDFKTLFKTKDFLTKFESTFSVVQCNVCQMQYLNPRPKLENIGLYYPPSFVSYQFEIQPNKSVDFKTRVLSNITRNAALNKVNAIKKLINKPEARVLDIGCGKGSFLTALNQTKGMQGVGLDFDLPSIDYCKNVLNLEMIDGATEALEQYNGKFDVITMWHFLEHSHDPSIILRHCRRLLAEDGVLVIEVPNTKSLESRLFKKKSYLFDVPRHLLNFSPATLQRLLNDANFKVDKIEYPSFSGGWIGTVQQIFFGGKIYNKLKSNLFSFLALSLFCYPFDRLSSVLGFGSILRVVVTKNETKYS